MQMARQALEIAQHLEAGDAGRSRAHRFDGRVRAAGVPGKIVRVEHDLAEPGRAHRATRLRAGRPG